MAGGLKRGAQLELEVLNHRVPVAPADEEASAGGVIYAVQTAACLSAEVAGRGGSWS